MEAWIKDIGESQCYTRFGKVIPKKETKVDVEKYFGRDVLEQLKSDKRIKVIVHNASNLQAEKKEAVKKEEVVKEKIAEEKKEVEKEVVTNLKKEPVKRVVRKRK